MCIAPGRFELPSSDPKSEMIDRYTTGLFCVSLMGSDEMIDCSSTVTSVRADLPIGRA